MAGNLKWGAEGVYAKLSDVDLHAELKRVLEMLDSPDATVFLRMLRELYAHQIELEIQHRKLQKAQQQLEESRDHYFSLYDAAALNYFSLDQHGVVIAANQAGASLVGMDRSSLIGMSFLNLVAQPEHKRFLHHLRKYLSGNALTNSEFLLDLPDGKSIEVQMTVIVPQFTGSTGKNCRVILTDLAERRQAEIRLQFSEKALESMQEGVMLTDAQGRIVAINPAFTRMTGYSADEAIGQTPAILKSGLHDDEFYRRIYDSLSSNDVWQGEIRNRHKNGQMSLDWLNISVIRNDSGEAEYYIGILSSISLLGKMNERLHKLAYYDELTGLPNRNLLYERLLLELAHSRRSPAMMAILCIALDGFKAINDLHGYFVGDQFLIEIGKRLFSCVREGDTVSRLGGDEFIALLRNIADEHVAKLVAGRMLGACAKPFMMDDGQELLVTASVGISVHPRDGLNGIELLSNADAALWRAKAGGKNNYQFFSESTLID
jgi:diguanylate cyclase (GGDEF)-like protein/PAS domain S-box-containing protein